jgi:hypothetical protein
MQRHGTKSHKPEDNDRTDRDEEALCRHSTVYSVKVSLFAPSFFMRS